MSNDVKCEYTAIAVRVAGAMSKKKNLVCYSFLIRHRDNCARHIHAADAVAPVLTWFLAYNKF